MIDDQTIVYTQVQSDKFHESKRCAGGVANRTRCPLREAVEASRRPCGVCCGGEVRETFEEVYDEITGP